MKYSLTHCYTDKNKGDAAIIISTVQLIKNIDKNAKINMFSTYGINDKRFNQDHLIIKKYADNIYPGCFHDPEPILGFGDKSRILSFILIFAKSLLLLVSENTSFLRLFLKKEEIESVKTYLNSDIIISKGGSYLTTQNKSLRQTLSLIRMLYPFIIAKRYKKKIYIFSQSLGPVQGSFNNFLFNFTLKKLDGIYLRESLCINKYKSVSTLCNKVKCKIIPDTAFFLQSNDDHLAINIDKKKYNIGYTLVDHAFKYIMNDDERIEKIKTYKISIIDSMKYLIDNNKNTIIHIFPQVLVDNSFLGHNDMHLSQEVKDYFNNTKYEKNINFYNKNLSPIELRNLYKNMEIFIGTRLHSVIFALSSYVPSINISYHGTKSQGIFNSIKGFSKFVLDINTITSNKLIDTIDELVKNREKLARELEQEVNKIKMQLIEAMKEIISGQN